MSKTFSEAWYCFKNYNCSITVKDRVKGKRHIKCKGWDQLKKKYFTSPKNQTKMKHPVLTCKKVKGKNVGFISKVGKSFQKKLTKEDKIKIYLKCIQEHNKFFIYIFTF